MKRIFQAFFFEIKGDAGKGFSIKKFFAFVFAFFLGIVNHLWLIFCPASHWIVILTEKGVESSALSVIMGTIDFLIIGALGVYGWSKAKKAA